MTDEEIIACYWQRDQQAVTASAEKYGTYCRSIAQNILQDPLDAEECVNDTWLRAWGSIPPNRPRRLKLFLARLTRNLALDRLRGRCAEKRGGGETDLLLEELSECVSGDREPESALLAKELGAEIDRFLQALPQRECSLFLKRYFYGESVKTLARAWGLTPHHVTVLLSRTRQKLKRYLNKEGFL